MTLDVFPDPRVSLLALLTSAKPTRWSTATIGNKVPSSSITVPHIQYAWDGTPSLAGEPAGCDHPHHLLGIEG